MRARTILLLAGLAFAAPAVTAPELAVAADMPSATDPSTYAGLAFDLSAGSGMTMKLSFADDGTTVNAVLTGTKGGKPVQVQLTGTRGDKSTVTFASADGGVTGTGGIRFISATHFKFDGSVAGKVDGVDVGAKLRGDATR